MIVGIVGSKDRMSDWDKDLIRKLVTSYPKDTVIVGDGTKQIGAFLETECEKQGLHFVKFTARITFPDTKYNRPLYTRVMRHRNRCVVEFVDKIHILVNFLRKGSAESMVRFARELGKDCIIEEDHTPDSELPVEAEPSDVSSHEPESVQP